MEWLQDTVKVMTEILQNGGPFLGVLLILLESIIPALPLGVFIALNIQAFGNIFGFLISWLSTVLGCVLSYLLFYYFVSDFLDKIIKKHKKQLRKLEKKLRKISFPNFVLLVALPFTPAFLVNIACGLSKMSYKKFTVGILLGKLSIVFFWGFIGTSFIESITDIETIMIISLMLVASYLLSRFVSWKMDLKD